VAFTYDPTTDRGRVRLLLFDTDSTVPIFQDADVDAFLGLTADGSGRFAVLEAAILGCNSIATGRALGAGTVTMGAFTLRREEVAAAYRASAEAYSKRLEDVAETALVDWTDEDTKWAKLVTGAIGEEKEEDRF
jgi:hypothetical protein